MKKYKAGENPNAGRIEGGRNADERRKKLFP